MDSYGNGYSAVGGKRSADDGAVEAESESKKQRCEPSRVVHLRNLHQYVTEQEVRRWTMSGMLCCAVCGCMRKRQRKPNMSVTRHSVVMSNCSCALQLVHAPKSATHLLGFNCDSSLLSLLMLITSLISIIRSSNWALVSA